MSGIDRPFIPLEQARPNWTTLVRSPIPKPYLRTKRQTSSSSPAASAVSICCRVPAGLGQKCRKSHAMQVSSESHVGGHVLRMLPLISSSLTRPSISATIWSNWRVASSILCWVTGMTLIARLYRKAALRRGAVPVVHVLNA
jgi:hypothetical protein